MRRRNRASPGSGMLAACFLLLQLNPSPTVVGHLLRNSHHHHQQHDNHDHDDFDEFSEPDHFPLQQHDHHHDHRHRRRAQEGPYHADVFDSCVVACYSDMVDRYGAKFANQMKEDGFHFEECSEEEEEDTESDNATINNSTTSATQQQQQRALNRILGATNQLHRLWSIPENRHPTTHKLRIPYKIKSTTAFTSETLSTISLAMQHIEQSTGVIQFTPLSEFQNQEEGGRSEYIYITYEDHYANYCAANLGRRSGTVTNLYLGWCRQARHFGNIVHELIHTLGFWHEHSRPDRDEHVSIDWDYVNTAARNNFAKATMVNSLGSPFDFNSIMMYPSTAFTTSPGQSTIVPVEPLESWETMGQRAQLSPHDVDQLRLLYQCKSGPRDGGVLPEDLCSEDCPCWEHAMGICDSDNECMGDLVCRQAPVILPNVDHVDQLPYWTGGYGQFSCNDWCHTDCCRFANSIVKCPESCDSAPPARILGEMPERMCVVDDGTGGGGEIDRSGSSTEATTTTTSTSTSTTASTELTTTTTTSTEERLPSGAPWYVNWDISRCVQYCMGPAPCGDFRQYDELYPSVQACCTERLHYKDFDDCHTIPEDRLGQFLATEGPTQFPSREPTESPSTGTPTTMPTVAPTGGPTEGPTRSPSASPVEATTTTTTTTSTTAVATTATADAGNNIISPRSGETFTGSGDWYVDWDITKCVRDCIGERPCRGRRKDPWELGHATAGSCCSTMSHVSLEDCSYAPEAIEERSGNNVDSKWYPATATCENDGNAPTWQHNKYSDQVTCCTSHFGWDYNNCMGITPAASSKWYVNWAMGKCVQDCDAAEGGSCGGLVEGNWIKTHASANACCRSDMSYKTLSECRYN